MAKKPWYRLYLCIFLGNKHQVFLAVAMTVNDMDSIQKWYVIHYQLKNESRLIDNLINQNFYFYIPKILILKSQKIKSTSLFPEYGFVQSSANQINALNYTKGLKYVLKNGSVYLPIRDSLIAEIQEACKDFQAQPLMVMPKLHSNVTILDGPLKGNLVKVMGFSKSDRVQILFNLLGRNVISETTMYNLSLA
jgi:transcription antitermination factor NusG